MSERMEEFAAAFPPVDEETWRQRVTAELKGADYRRRLVTMTPEGIAIEPLYGPEADPGPDPWGVPESFPFVRGAACPRDPLHCWDVCVEIRQGDPAAAREAVRRAIAGGATALRLVLGGGVRLGRDAGPGDDEAAPSGREAAGGEGVLISTAEEFEELLGEADLSRVAVMLDGASGGFAATAALVEVARRRGVEPGRLRGGLGDDPLAQLLETGLLPEGFTARWRLMAEQAAWCRRRAPGVRAVQVSTLPYREAGAGAVLELAYALATAVEYLRLMILEGVAAEDAARQISFLSGVGRDLFMEIAKLRALRGCWARIVEASGGSIDPGSGVQSGGDAASSRGSDPRDGESGQRAVESAAAARIHLRSLVRRRTRRDPWVNILRGTVESVVAAAAGADAVTILPFDSAIGPSDELAERLARNTQVIAQEESHLGWVRDPAGGSWYIETLTRQIAEMAWAHFQRIEAAGGMARHLLEGRVAEEVGREAAATEEAVAKGRAPVTGVSSYPLLEEEPVVREAEERAGLLARAAARLEAHREHFDQAAAVAELGHRVSRKGLTVPLEQDPTGVREESASRGKQASREDRRPPVEGALMEAAIAAAGRGASLGTIHGALDLGQAAVHLEPLAGVREAAGFEALRDASDAHLRRTGARPRVFLVPLGPVAAHKARVGFAARLLASGGIEAGGAEGSSAGGNGPEAAPQDGFVTVEAAVSAYLDAPSPVAVICGSDESYAELLAGLAPALHDAGARLVLVTARPGGEEAALRETGIDGFLHVGCHALDLLELIQTELEVTP